MRPTGCRPITARKHAHASRHNRVGAPDVAGGAVCLISRLRPQRSALRLAPAAHRTLRCAVMCEHPQHRPESNKHRIALWLYLAVA